MYERHGEPLLPRGAFVRRLAYHAGASLGLVGLSLFGGMLGYHVLEGLSWIDAFVNAAMLLGGMGPVTELHTNGGKLFAGLYALYAGLVFLIAAGVIFVPVLHRFLHSFHLEAEAEDSAPADSAPAVSAASTPPSKGPA
jgi:hypothetical protein